YALTMARRGGRKTTNRIALLWTLGCAVMSFVGAGFLGFAHTLPQVNLWTHGTLITAMHGHMAFWGAYAMIVLAMISYAMPELTGRAMYKSWMAEWAFWATNVGMIGMTGAFAVMGIAQVYMERKAGMDFLEVQESLQVHAFGLVLAASLLTLGVALFIKNFLDYGFPQEVPTGAPAGAKLDPRPADRRKDH
ncbi:MAG TPA: cbb3-type cytochrome c oxidase subunit I, partial [Planctomycetota bacterium]|nr:cbb3-type cytochrome c oxidase subunit I [Planctomycetota bacterium]